VKIFLEKELKEDCSNIRKYVERMITQRDLASAIPPMFATYVAREKGNVDVGKIFCALDATFLTGGATVTFKKVNPLLERFNIHMRLY